MKLIGSVEKMYLYVQIRSISKQITGKISIKYKTPAKQKYVTIDKEPSRRITVDKPLYIHKMTPLLKNLFRQGTLCIKYHQ